MIVIRYIFALLLAFLPHLLQAQQTRPNILWISSEDMSPHLGCYGHAQATTPNLDRLAEQGVRYANAFTVTGVCATCRASIITGMFPSTLGNQFMRCQVDLPSHVRLFPEYFRDAGYYCTNRSKTDYNVTGDHGRCWDESSRTAHWRDRPRRDQPFFAVFNFTTTHESRIFNYRQPPNLTDDDLHDPAKMQLPPYYPDTPVTRGDWAHYFNNITSMDKQAGEVLNQLDEDGLAEDTIVVYWSDHGVGLPRAKRWIYESGTHVPLIVRIPPKFRVAGQGVPGSVKSELVSLMDLGPTMLTLAGLEVPDYMHGRAFLGAGRDAPRQFIYTIRDRMDERYDMIRGVRNDRFKYIRNYQPFKPYFQVINYMEQEHTMKELRRLHEEGKLSDEAEQFMADHKPIEEFYDLKTDPHEINNLIDEAANRPELQQALDLLREKHREWIFETRDTGLIPEADLAQRAGIHGTRFQILRQPDSDQLLVRLLDVNSKACRADDSQSLIDAYADQDPAVRYWAVTGLGNQESHAVSTLDVIHRALEDPAETVRIAAARAAWQAGETEKSIPVLKKSVLSDEEFVSLLAIHVIDEMDLAATVFTEVIQAVKKRGKGYPARVATYLLDKAG